MRPGPSCVAARDARNAASAQVQTLRAELVAAQEAEEQAPVLALESQIEELNEQVSGLTAQVEATAKEEVDATQRATDAEQRATEAAQQITVAEQETAEAEEQVADLELNLYEVAKGCYLDDSTVSEEFRTETDAVMCLSQDLISLDTCSPAHMASSRRNTLYSLGIGREKNILLSPLQSVLGKAGGEFGILYRWDRGSDVRRITFRTGNYSFLVDIAYQSKPDEEVNLDEETNDFATDLRALRDRITAITRGEMTENTIPICEE